MFRIIPILLLFLAFEFSIRAAEIQLHDPMRPERLGRTMTNTQSKLVLGGNNKKTSKILVLQQTIVSDQRRLAIISGVTLGEGGVLKNGFRVKSIREDSVVLQRKSEKIELYLAGKINIKELSR